MTSVKIPMTKDNYLYYDKRTDEFFVIHAEDRIEADTLALLSSPSIEVDPFDIQFIGTIANLDAGKILKYTGEY